MGTLSPIIEWLNGGWAHVYWAPFGVPIFEGLIAPEIMACLRVLCVAVPMLLIAWTIQRWEDYHNDPRQK